MELPRDLAGRTFGEFVVREKMGEGGFGDVYRAEQPALEREAVIKVLQARRKDDAVTVQRFMREARLASRLDHPYAAHMYAFGAEPDGVLWIAMEMVRGEALDKILVARGPLPLDRFVPFVEQICEVLHTAHERGIVHRDIKPANVMVLSRAGKMLPKLLDFGLAKVIEGSGASAVVAPEPATPAALAGGSSDSYIDDDSGHTAQLGGSEGGALLGTPAYMPPEQWRGQTVADARSDQYALGVMCFELLTGRRPFLGESVDEVRASHLHDPLPPLGPKLPPALHAVLARATAKQAEARFPSVLELAAALRAASDLAPDAVPVPQLDEAVRDRALAEAPKPIAEAVLVLDSARNPHQARDAMWMVLRAAARTVGVVAMACRSRAGAPPGGDGEAVMTALKALHRRELEDGEWVALAAALVAPFQGRAEGFPVPELVALFGPRGEPPFDAALAARAEAPAGGGEAGARAALELGLPLVAELLRRLAFLDEYPIVVRQGDVLERWMGARRRPRTMVGQAAAGLVDRAPALADWKGRPVVSLAPLAQVAPPAPGAPDELFLFAGRRRRQALLVAPPHGFERTDDAVWDWLKSTFAVDDVAASGERRGEVAPYRGLEPFRVEDSGSFFGREAEVEAFVNRLRVTPLCAVIGASGAGKSSFVQAGVIPALPSGWHATVFRPGSTPTAALARARAAAPGDGTLVIVVDQLEELFTLCADPAERARFAEALAAAAPSADEPVRVVLTLRDDFLARVSSLPALRRRIDAGLTVLTVPPPDELRRILVEPAKRAGYDFEDPELPAEMVAEVAEQPGALALLSFTAAELWALRDRHFARLTVRSYRGLGGVAGALATHAEATLAKMSAEERRLTRAALRNLVTADGTRARLLRSELYELLGGGPAAEGVVEHLIGARLLVSSESDDHAGERVEIVHEALLSAWPRLVSWRAEDAEGVRLRDALRAAARQWQERGRPRGLLWRDDAVAELERWRARVAPALTDGEKAFAAASSGEAARGRRLKGLATGATIAALALAAAVLLLLWRQAGAERARAEASARDAELRVAQLYMEQGRQALASHDPLHALVYLDEALRRGLGGAVNRFLIARGTRLLDKQRAVLAGHEGAVRTSAFSPDGKLVATGDNVGAVRLWDAATGRQLVVDRSHKGMVRSVAFSPDGKLLATASNDKTVRLWEVPSGRAARTLEGHTAEVGAALWSKDGARLYTRSSDGTVGIWDVASGERRARIEVSKQAVYAFALSPDETRLATGGADQRVRVHELPSGRVLAENASRGAVMAVVFAPDGTKLLAAGHQADTFLMDVTSGERLARLGGQNEAVFAVAFSADGKRMLIGGTEDTVSVFDVDGAGRVATLRGHTALVTSAVFTRDGARVVSSSDDGTARLWSATSGKPLALMVGHRALVSAVELSADETRLLTRSLDGTARVWDTRPDDLVAEAPPRSGRLLAAGWTGSVVTDDGGVRLVPRDGGQPVPLPGVASAAADGGGRVWTLSGRKLARFGADGQPLGSLEISEDVALLAAAGEWVAASDKQGTVRLWRGGGPPAEPLSFPAGPRVTALAVSVDGARVITGGGDKSARVWDVARKATVATLAGHGGSVTAAAFSADGSLAATGGDDGAVRLYEAATGKLLYTLDRHEGAVTGVAFGERDTRLVTYGADGGKVWDIAPDARAVDEVSRDVRCRVPLRLEGDVVVAADSRCD